MIYSIILFECLDQLQHVSHNSFGDNDPDPRGSVRLVIAYKIYFIDQNISRFDRSLQYIGKLCSLFTTIADHFGVIFISIAVLYCY